MKSKNIKYKIAKGTVYGVTNDLKTVIIAEVKGDKKEVKERIKFIKDDITLDIYKTVFSEINEIERNLELTTNDLERIFELKNETTNNEFDEE